MYNINDYKSAFKCFEERFLKGKKSIFNLDNDEKILNKDSIEYLIDNFTNKGLGGDADFITKIKCQLLDDCGKSKDENKNKDEEKNKIQKQAIEILATAVWLWRLAPANSTKNGKIKSVQEILNLNKELKKIDLEKNPFFNENIKGFASAGTYYYTNKPFELAYIINFFEKALENDNYIEIINELKDKITIKEYGKLNKDFQLIENKNSKEIKKTASMFNTLLHLIDSNNYEPIISKEHKKKIVETFSYLVCEKNKNKFEPEIDWKIKCIKEKLKEKYPNFKNFYDENIIEIWNETILPAKNIIYYGAPGTGKTYQVSNLIKNKTQNNENLFKIVQFHPSFSYEDFIEGLKPILKDKNIVLELKNGIFKEFCKKAIDTLKKERKEGRENNELTKFYFVVDEINRAELSNVFGELLVCLEEDKRIDFDKNGKITKDSFLIETQYSYLNDDTNCLIKHKDSYKFGIPINLYFIGTMNDIDRSIDSFDLALRRRFTWVRKDCDYDVITSTLLEKEIDDDELKNYIDKCKNFNKYINEKLGLGQKYELGHSYFMKVKIKKGKIIKNSIENLFNLELSSLLREYLRSEFDEKEIETHLKCMKKIFVNGEKCDKDD